MTDDDAVQKYEGLADVAAAHEQTGAVVDPRDAGQRAERAHQIRLRAGRPDDVERGQGQRGAAGRGRLAADDDGFGDAGNRQRHDQGLACGHSADLNFARHESRKTEDQRRA